MNGQMSGRGLNVATAIPSPKNPRQVPTALDHLFGTIDLLESSVKLLEENISPILRCIPPNEERPKQVANEQPVIIAHQIQTAADRIVRITEFVNDIINRTEV